MSNDWKAIQVGQKWHEPHRAFEIDAEVGLDVWRVRYLDGREEDLPGDVIRQSWVLDATPPLPPPSARSIRFKWRRALKEGAISPEQWLHLMESGYVVWTGTQPGEPDKPTG
jgi:hypothetical protein